jgi:hypothetical protein
LHWSVLSLFIGFLLSVYFCRTISHPRMRTQMFQLSFVMAGLFILLSWFCYSTMRRVKKNQTLIESRFLKSKTRYDSGSKENLREILGDGLFRRWWPRPGGLTGFEWSDPEFQKLM